MSILENSRLTVVNVYATVYSMDKTTDTKCWFGKTGCGPRCANEGTHGDRRSFMSDFVKAARFCDKHRSADMKPLAATVSL